jgi:hypothetical protein
VASEVDVCNLALSHIGDEANVSAIDPADGSVQAEHCSRFYPIARDAMLEAHAWKFNTKRETLAEFESNPQEEIWAYAYALPNLCLRPLRVLFPEATDDRDAQDFEVEADEDGALVLYTNVEDAELVFLTQVTDTAKFSPAFVIALSYLLAHFLAGPITKDLKLKAGMYQSYIAAGGPPIDARGLDASGRKNNSYGTNHTPAHLKARQ